MRSLREVTSAFRIFAEIEYNLSCTWAFMAGYDTFETGWLVEFSCLAYSKNFPFATNDIDCSTCVNLAWFYIFYDGQE